MFCEAANGAEAACSAVAVAPVDPSTVASGIDTKAAGARDSDGQAGTPYI